MLKTGKTNVEQGQVFETNATNEQGQVFENRALGATLAFQSPFNPEIQA